MPDGTTFGADDAAWLVVAELLDRRANALKVDGSDTRDVVDVALDDALGRVFGPARDGAAQDTSDLNSTKPATDGRAAWEARIADAVLHLADVMEEAGALHLAFGVLSSLGRALPSLGARHQGLAAAARARTARLAGATETAAGLYAVVAQIGRDAGDHDLVARSLLGRAVLARRRGNYPESRTLYRRALRTAERAGARTLAGLAHHGLLIAASVSGDVAGALVHGGKAFELFADHPARQADLLGTLGAVGSAAGFFDAALQAYLGAARRSSAPRVRLPALAGAAVCAAYLGDAGRLTAITESVERDLVSNALPFERAQALALLAEAWAVYRPATGGEPYTTRARVAARAGDYHELVAQVEAIGSPGLSVRPVQRADGGGGPPTVPPRARQVLRELEQLDAYAPHLTPSAHP